MSQTKISRIETRRTIPTVLEVEQILKALDVPEEVAEELLKVARRANVDYASWRAYARIGLYHKQAELRALESSSREMRHFLPAIPTGLLHVRQYAEQTLSRTVRSAPARDVQRAVQARMDRQAILDDRSRTFTFLLTEQAVKWRRATSEVMAAQCRHMAKVSEKPNVDVAIIPQSAEVPATPLNVFVVYDDRFVTVELFSGEVALRDPIDVSHHLDLFALFLGHALQGDEARSFLHESAEVFMRERD